ncbi:MAG: radical SAM protein [Patescibacteria group bacterium]|nr:radical SAM protein [Patescibacteria group bacterium]
MILNILKSAIKNKLGIIQYPSFITFLVTWQCNGRCIFCDVWKRKPAINEELSVEEIKKIFKQFKKIDVLRLSGGEPFLRADLADIINGIEEVNPPAMIHITTNGILTDRIIKTIKAVKPLRKIHLKVSIDDIGEKHNKIRNVPDAYDNAFRTVRELAGLRSKTNFHLGVNQVIAEESQIDSYPALENIFKKYGVPVYPVIAHSANSLYSGKGVADPSSYLKTFTPFSKPELKRFFNMVLKKNKENKNLTERIVDRYRLKGLYNRLVENKNKPQPKCVALNNHLRILPNGDIPICIYNSTVVGNLKENKFKDIWFNKGMAPSRKWVRNCSGCWQGCECKVNGIYTGDIWKGLIC